LVVSIYTRFFLASPEGYALLPRHLFPSIAKRLTNMYGEVAASQILYSIGKEVGIKEGISYVKAGLLKPHSVGWLGMMLTYLGLGDTRVSEFKEKERLTLRIKNSPESACEECRHKVPSCHIMRGFLAGMSSALYENMYAECTETACASAGSEVCEFHVRWFEKLQPPRGGGGGVEKTQRDKRS